MRVKVELEFSIESEDVDSKDTQLVADRLPLAIINELTDRLRPYMLVDVLIKKDVVTKAKAYILKAELTRLKSI